MVEAGGGGGGKKGGVHLELNVPPRTHQNCRGMPPPPPHGKESVPDYEGQT